MLSFEFWFHASCQQVLVENVVKPVFFVGKKDNKKKMVQDYRYLNKWTIKNNYPLPLILDIVENIGTKKGIYKNGLEMGL